MSQLLRTSLLALLALPMTAQTPGLSLDGGPIAGFDSLQKVTNNKTGFQVGLDYTGHVPGTDFPARSGLTLARFPGQDWNGLKTSLGLVQLHGDLLVPGTAPIYGILGASLNTYSLSEQGTEDTADPLDIDHHFPVRNAKGLKLGLRLGLGCTLGSHLALEAILQQTELAGKDLQDPLVRQGGINPGWLELTFRYTF